MKVDQLRAELAANRKKFAPADRQTKESEATYQPQSRYIQAGLEPFTGTWTRETARHLARRCLFGASKSEVETLYNLGFNDAISQILSKGPEPAVPVNDYNNDDLTDTVVPFGSPWVGQPVENEDIVGQRVVSLKSWWIEQMLNQSLSIEEKMVYFWHNHLVTEAWGVFWPDWSYDQFKLFRDHALGNFKELVYQITIDPAMLVYLNGAANNREQPDENYARELQELFCIGKGPNAHYTESDVKEMARVLTGWSVLWEGRTMTWYDWAHDTEDKTFSSFYGNRTIAGRSGENGQEETQELVDMIFENQECALFFCRKLYRFFVYHDIDAATEQNVIEPMAEILRSNNYNIQPVLEALISSQHFYTDENIGSLIKSPFDFMAGFWRTMGVQYPQNDIRSKFHIHTSMLWNMSSLGQEAMDPPNVAGYPAYYQIPQFDKQWITTETIPNRAIITDSFVHWGFWSQSVLTHADLLAFVKQLEQPTEPNALISEVCDLLLGSKITENGRIPLKSILLSGQMSDHYWTDAWLSYINDPSVMNTNIVESRLKLFFQRLLQMAEFQIT